MKTLLAVVVIIAGVVAAGYYGLPIMIEKETAAIRTEVKDLSERLQKTEAFVKQEEEARKDFHLPADADAQKIIKTINALAAKLASTEESLNKGLSAAGEEIKKQKAESADAIKKQMEALDKLGKETRANIQKSLFNALMAGIRGNVLKAKVDLVEKNIGNAKNELESISDLLEKARTMASDENRKAVEDLQGTLRKAKSEIDTDLSAAINRVDLLWHDMSKLIKVSS